MRQEIGRFRQREYRSHPRRPRNAIRYPLSLQRRVVADTRRCQAEGKSLWVIARELGLGQETLRGWMGRQPEPGFRRVAVAAAVSAVSPAKKPDSALVLVTPKGYRVEGLDQENLAALLRCLA